MANPIDSIARWLAGLFTGWGLSQGLVNVILMVIGILVLASFLMVLDILLVWVERKVVARFQDRLGPNRLGPYGLVQPVADVIKLLIKEDITPDGADRIVYNLSPILALTTVLLLWAVIPFAPTILGTDINVGVLFIVAIGAISTLGIIMAGWASNNKYALLGAFRTVAQMVSYEVPMVIVLLVPVILARSMGINTIVHAQYIWFIVIAPLAALIFLVTSIAELGRSPFDLNEAESEIVAGFHIEYTGMKFGLFYAGELLHALTVSAIFASLFLGGWRGPFVQQVPILGVVYLFVKAFFVYWVIMWIRYSMPRIRIDHMLGFNWKFLTPLSLVVLLVTAILDKLVSGYSIWIHSLSMLAANLVIAWIVLAIVRGYARRERARVAEPMPFAQPQETSTSAS
ncbi:MAG: NADH-quinone oxidoreductase subunit NuoH [Anaerolineales bacterium]|jgi:NADH-quinone oxidoreductase subunit H